MSARRGFGAVLTCYVVVGALLAGSSFAAGGGGPDPVTKLWPTWPYRTSCAGHEFDPVALFSKPADAEHGSTASELALRRFLRDPVIGWVPRHHYRVLWQGKRAADFISSGLTSNPRGGRAPEVLGFSLRKKGWTWTGSGPCVPQSVVQGHVAIGWDLADGQHLGPRTRAIEIRLGPGECASGRSQNERAHAVWGEVEGKLTLAVWLTPVHGGQTCEGLIEPPLEVRLPEALGDREIFDAGTYPPHPARGAPRNY
jgi:hypothetical protein